jgi:alkaline phosphatase D
MITWGAEFQVAKLWAAFAATSTRCYTWARDRRIGGAVLLSGDRHVTAGYQVQGGLSRSPRARSPQKITSHPYNPAEMFMLRDQRQVFIVFSADTATAEPSLTFEEHQVGIGILRQRGFN